MPSSDRKSFSTLVCLYDISKELIEYKRIHPNSKLIHRPSDDALNNLYVNQILPFWDYLLNSYPEINQFVDGTSTNSEFVRNNENGGSLLLRPEGQITIAELYKYFQQKGVKEFLSFESNLPKLDFNLSNILWKYLYWNNNKMNHKNRSLKKKLLLYLLNEKIDKKTLKDELDAYYKAFNDTFEIKLEPVK